MMIKALVAARGGSQRVTAKNTRPFADSTLLDIKLRQLTRLEGLDGVVLSSEDENILSFANKYGVTGSRRPADLASSDAQMSDAYAYMAADIDADAIVYANCTSPLVKDATVESLIRQYRSLNLEEHDSLNTANAVREFLWLDGQPMNYDPQAQPRSQDLPLIGALNFAVNIIARDTMRTSRNVVGMRPRLHFLDDVEGLDIDTPNDFAIAEHLFWSKGGERYLRDQTCKE